MGRSRKEVVHKAAARKVVVCKAAVHKVAARKEVVHKVVARKVAVHKTVDCVVDNKTRFPVVRKGAGHIHHEGNPFKGGRYNSYFPDPGFFPFSSY